MPNPSEMERIEQETQAEHPQYNRTAPTTDGGIGHKEMQVAIPSREQQIVKLEDEMAAFDSGLVPSPAVGEFERKLEALINEQSMEAAGGDTPDFILARYLRLQLDIFHATVRRRAHWYGARDELFRG